MKNVLLGKVDLVLLWMVSKYMRITEQVSRSETTMQISMEESTTTSVLEKFKKGELWEKAYTISKIV